MAEINAALVKELRELSGAGMMDCKKALTETSGDIEGAVDWLRKKGLAAAAKKAGRVAAEGLVGAAAQDRRGALVEVNSETDFVARNEHFQAFVKTVAELALQAPSVDALREMPYPGGSGTIADQLTSLVTTIGENMSLRRSAVLAVDQGIVASYVHAQAAPGLGKIGVLVALESAADQQALLTLGRQLAMHVAAANPQALSTGDVDPAALDRERAVLSEQARASGKSEDVVAKMVEGRLRKYYEEVVLLEQVYVVDTEQRVRQVLEGAGKQLGHPVQIRGYVRMALGEGIQREQKDFAAEVAAQLT